MVTKDLLLVGSIPLEKRPRRCSVFSAAHSDIGYPTCLTARSGSVSFRSTAWRTAC